MSLHLALVHPTDLLASELREALGRRRELWRQLDLLSDQPAEIGTLTEIGGSAAMVGELDEAALEAAEIVVFGGRADHARSWLDRVPATTTVVLMAPEATPDDGHPLVAGVNLETAHRDGVMLSPHPGTVALAHLLAPLRTFGLARVHATLLEPVSTVGKAGLDEMFDQTRAILAFADTPPREVFPTQMAFNVLPGDPEAPVAAHLKTVFGLGDLPIGVQTLKAPVFHSYGIALQFELVDDPGLAEVEQALETPPYLDRAVDVELLGPIDAANRDEVLVGPVQATPGHPGSYQAWAVMDNLTCGGALNTLAILEALSQPTLVS